MIGYLVLYIIIGLFTTFVAEAYLEGDDPEDVPLFVYFLFWPVLAGAGLLVGLLAGTEYVLQGVLRGQWDWRFRL